MSDEPDLLKPDEVTENRLQIELGNLREENEALRAENTQTKKQYLELLQTSASRVEGLQSELAELRSQLESLQATPLAAPPSEFELPDAFDILNEVKAIPKYKATKIGLVEAILGIIKRLTPDREN